MAYDLVVKNGTVVDGSGASGYVADVGVSDGRIAYIGPQAGHARQSIDAEGHVVAPGFVDGHTHMDAQVFWDPLGSCSCYHGVTSVVMGNCGFTLAPCRESEADLVFRNLERAEDIAREAVLASIDWQWESYPEYLDVLDGLRKGINYAGYVGHSPTRPSRRAWSMSPAARANAMRRAAWPWTRRTGTGCSSCAAPTATIRASPNWPRSEASSRRNC